MPNNPNLHPGTPYQAPTGDDKHRIVLKGLRYENRHLAKPGETVIDFKNGIFYAVDDAGRLVSKASDIAQIFNNLKESGALSAAMTYLNNADIYTVYVKDDKCYPADRIRLSPDVKYYAIRAYDTKSEAYKYITGKKNSSGQVTNILANVSHPDTGKVVIVDGVLTTVQFTGKCDMSWIHDHKNLYGRPLFIDFFDKNSYIMSTVPCQLVNVSHLADLGISTMNIVGLKITTNQEATDGNGSYTFVYEGQPLNYINIWVNAVYNDGTERNLNHEIASGRLMINLPKFYPKKENPAYPNDITKATPYTINDEFNITASYFLHDDYIEDTAMSQKISVEKRCKIVKNVYKPVKYLLPVPYVPYNGGMPNNNGQVSLKYAVYAMYEDNTFGEIGDSGRLHLHNITHTHDTNEHSGKVSLKLGFAENEFSVNTFKFTMSDDVYGWYKYVSENETGLYVTGYPGGLGAHKFPENIIPLIEVQYNELASQTGQGTMKIVSGRSAVSGGNEGKTSCGITFGTVLSMRQLIDIGTGTDSSGEIIKPNLLRIHSVAYSGISYIQDPVQLTSDDTVPNITYVDSVYALKQEKLNPGNINGKDVRYPVLIEFINSSEENGVTVYKTTRIIPAMTRRI